MSGAGVGGQQGGRLNRAEWAGGFGVARGPPPSLRAWLGCISPSPPPGAPALKVTFTVAPACGPGFTRGVPGRAAAANTRVPDRGETCTRMQFRGVPAPQTDGRGGPTPYAPGHGELSGLGSLDTCSVKHPLRVRIPSIPCRAAGLRVRLSLGLLRLGLWEECKLGCVFREGVSVVRSRRQGFNPRSAGSDLRPVRCRPGGQTWGSACVWGQSQTPWQEVVFVPELDH